MIMQDTIKFAAFLFFSENDIKNVKQFFLDVDIEEAKEIVEKFNNQIGNGVHFRQVEFSMEEIKVIQGILRKNSQQKLIDKLYFNKIFPLSIKLYVEAGVYPSRLIPESGFLDNQCVKYLNSGYWTVKEEDAWWYYCLNFPYAIYNAADFFHKEMGWLGKVKKIFQLLGDDFNKHYSDEEAKRVIGNLTPLETNNIFGKVFDFEIITLCFLQKIGNKKGIKIVKEKLKWIKKLKIKREEIKFQSPADLKFCLSCERTREMGFVTIPQLRAIFNLSDEQFSEKKLINIFGEDVRVFNHSIFMHLEWAISKLLKAGCIDKKYLMIENYQTLDSDWRAESAYYYLINIVRQQMISSTLWLPEPKSIPFSDFSSKNISKADVLYAAKNSSINIYASGEVGLKIIFNEKDCLLFRGEIESKSQNTRYDNLLRLKPEGFEYYGNDIEINTYGLTVKMLKNSKSPKLKYDSDLSRKVCKIIGEPTDIEAAFGVEAELIWEKEQVENYLEHVVIIESEWQEYLKKQSKNIDNSPANKPKNLLQTFLHHNPVSENTLNAVIEVILVFHYFQHKKYISAKVVWDYIVDNKELFPVIKSISPIYRRNKKAEIVWGVNEVNITTVPRKTFENQVVVIKDSLKMRKCLADNPK